MSQGESEIRDESYGIRENLMESKGSDGIKGSQNESRGVTCPRKAKKGLGKARKGGLSKKGKGVGKRTRAWEIWREKKKVVMNVT